MALHGCLKIGGRKYGVVACSYSFQQQLDNTGTPSTRPMGGEIQMTIPATSDDDMFFYNWMFNKSEVKAGILRFRIYADDNKPVYKTVAFANAYCVFLSDSFSDSDSKLMYTTIRISAQVIRIGAANSATFTNAWSTQPVTVLINNLANHVMSTIANKLNPF